MTTTASAAGTVGDAAVVVYNSGNLLTELLLLAEANWRALFCRTASSRASDKRPARFARVQVIDR